MKTINFFNLVMIVLSITYFTSCDEIFDDRIEGDKNVITESRNITNFDELISEGKFEVYVSIANTASLRIEAEENLVPFIVTKVRDNKLYIDEKDKYRLDNNRPMSIYITTPYLEELTLTGSGRIECDSLDVDYFDVEITGSGRIEMKELYVKEIEAEISGSGDILLEGVGDISEYDITGSGSIRAINFKHVESDSRVTGSGNIYVYATDYLKATITGSGDIYYEAYPDINEHITGTGDVHRY